MDGVQTYTSKHTDYTQNLFVLAYTALQPFMLLIYCNVLGLGHIDCICVDQLMCTHQVVEQNRCLIGEMEIHNSHPVPVKDTEPLQH